MSVEVGKYGRIVLPKEIRDKHKINEGSRFIVRERFGEIVLVPVRRYAQPTDALYRSIQLDKPVEEPKKVAREHIKRKLTEEYS
ncbi:MAG: AbrB/MazE/SpoVT family DNA-binding domain-containing protein [Candidatus Bathyarchaeales archaeon]